MRYLRFAWLFLLGLPLLLTACAATGAGPTTTPTLVPAVQQKVEAAEEAGIDASKPAFVFVYANG